MRSVERTVEEVLLPGVAALDERIGRGGFAWRWATGWLAAAKRVAPPATREEAVVIFDASAPGDVDVAARAGARARAAPPRPAHARRSAPTLDPVAPGARAARGRPARRRAHRPPRVARRARPARLRGAPRAATRRRGLRLPRRAARDRREHGRAPRRPTPLAAAERIVAVVDGRAGRATAATLRAVTQLTHRVRRARR